MGRYYKIILSLCIAIFLVTSTISAYESNDINLMSITNLLQETHNKKSKESNLWNLKNNKEGYINLCVQDTATSDTKSIENEDVADEETDEKLKSVLTKDEYELIVEKDNKKVNDLQIKFKIVEVFQKILDLKQDDCQI